jgi:hypothetical protein
MVQLAAAIFAAAGWQALTTSTRRWKAATGALLLIAIVIEYLPYPQRLATAAAPAYVTALQAMPDGAVLDLASNGPQALYHQTIHGKPIAFGYISRTATSVDNADQELARQILNGLWEELASRGFRYVVKRERAAEVMIRGLDRAPLPPIDPSREVFRDGDIAIYKF